MSEKFRFYEPPAPLSVHDLARLQAPPVPEQWLTAPSKIGWCSERKHTFDVVKKLGGFYYCFSCFSGRV